MGKLIIKKNNMVRYLTIISPFVFAFIIKFLLRNFTRQQSLNFLAGYGVMLIVYFIFYKYFLWKEEPERFIIWDELPLHLCNVNAIFTVISSVYDIHLLQVFCYVVGTLGAFLAMFMPEERFINIPLNTAKYLGYYGFHIVLAVGCLLQVLLNITVPEYKDAFGCVIFLTLLACVMHVVNTLFRKWFNCKANYMYTYRIIGNPVMDFLYKKIPYYLLFELPLMPVMAVAALVIIYITRLFV